MSDLFDIYPKLRTRIDGLCRNLPWCVAGASALVHDGDALFLPTLLATTNMEMQSWQNFEITRPELWQRRQDGDLVAGIGGIGGSIEQGETILECLYREAEEELGVRIEVESASETHLVYEQRTLETMAPQQREYPLPMLCTISENLYRRERYPGCSILVFVTIMARLSERPTPKDLYGLVIVPRQALAAVFMPDEMTLGQLRRIPDVRILIRETLPDDLLLSPVWTGRSFQLLLQAGRL